MTLEESIKKIEELRQVKKKLEDEAMIILASFFKEKNIDEVVIRGTTPSFNDGDPCTHSTYVMATFDEYFEFMFYEDQEEMESIREEKLSELKKKNFIESVKESDNKLLEDNIFNKHLSKEDGELLSKFLYEISDYFERKYYTNFEIVLSYNKETEKIEESSSEYHEY